MSVPLPAWAEEQARRFSTPMFWCESCGYADIPAEPDDADGRPAGERCPCCGESCTHVTPMMPVDKAPWHLYDKVGSA